MSDNDVNFDNERFWSHRYFENPTLGSGIGSRGKNLSYKREIVDRIFKALKPQTILDIGCGDHALFNDVVDFEGYIGIDISKTIIEVNINKFKKRKFIYMDVANVTDIYFLRSDVVLCLEVLIHQHNWKEYYAIAENIVASAVSGGLVSGYISDPRPFISSEIIAWHEPITDTLQRVGARDVTIEAKSLESDCLAFVSFRT